MDSMRRNTLSFLNECSIYSKGFCVIFVICHLITLPGFAPYLCIRPGYLLPPNFWLWTLFTFPFCERHIWNVVLNILTIFLVEKLLLPLWKWIELVKFCLIVNVTSAVLTAFFFYIIYVFTFDHFILFKICIDGLIPLFAALTVAGRQQMGDNVLLTLPSGNLRNKHIPFCLVCVTLILVLFRLIDYAYLPMCVNGILVSWVYLRFYQKHNTGGKGDYSDEFTFAGFFPNHLEPPVAILSNTIFSLLIRLKVCKKFDRRYDLNSPTTITLNISGIDVHDSERRKQLALKALNERLSRPDTTTQWPSMVDESKESGVPSTVNPSKESSPPGTSTKSPTKPESVDIQMESGEIPAEPNKATGETDTPT